ncbi:Gag-pol polyprotein-like protein [Theobroma cacao]|uniref:Gag-pol polyprotein-like protein n=1 Tax=Theobroma cacao TaxID=3641 RepID=A0A061EVZ6_THECC|nr:Gag-pol polyprotein-like protein [Theobroma cacao]
MTTPNITHQPPPVFDGSNYGVWAVKMKTYLKGYNLWNAVEQDTEPQAPRENAPVAQVKQYEEEIAKKFRALSFIQSAISEDIFNRIMECETAKAAWTKLQEEYLKEVRVVEKILNSVPGKFEPTITSLLQSKDLPDISITEIISALQAAELRISARDEALEEKAFLAKGKGKAKVEAFIKKNYKDKDKKIAEYGQSSNKKNKFNLCSFCTKRNHTDDYCWFRPDAKCKICSQSGHTDKVCKNRTIEDKPAQTNESLELTEEVLFMAQSNSESDFRNCEWLLDSGSSRHIALFESVFVDLDKNYRSKVRIKNGGYLQAYGIGKVRIQSSTGHRQSLQNLQPLKCISDDYSNEE